MIRVSGPACVSVYEALCPDVPLPKPRVAGVRTLYEPDLIGREQKSQGNDGGGKNILDAGALVLYFPAPKTATGEDVLEFHVHGGPAIVKAVLGAIARTNRAASDLEITGTIRYAEPGEFTRRAFMNNRLELPQIEALGETLTADTEQQRRLAVRGASDALSKRYEEWRYRLLYARGELEALIDFAEDQHFDESAEELLFSVAAQVHVLQAQMGFHIQNASKGELLRNGIRIALLGAPNAGKSSLLNRVVGKEAAIVSTEEGTTRDIVDVGVDLGGWFCKLGDMAGIRADGTGTGTVVIGAVEKEGIRRARARALESDVVVVVVALEDDPARLSVEQEVIDATNDCIEAGKCILIAVNKCDRLPASEHNAHIPQNLAEQIHTLFPAVSKNRIFGISCQQAESSPLDSQIKDPGYLQHFLRGLISTFEQIASPSGIEGDEHGNYDLSYWEDSLGVTHRQSSNLERCKQHLDDFLVQAQPSSFATDADGHELGYVDAVADMGGEVDIVTAAENLRFAADALAKITGKGESGDVEDVLGVVFEKYVLSCSFMLCVMKVNG